MSPTAFSRLNTFLRAWNDRDFNCFLLQPSRHDDLQAGNKEKGGVCVGRKRATGGSDTHLSVEPNCCPAFPAEQHDRLVAVRRGNRSADDSLARAHDVEALPRIRVQAKNRKQAAVASQVDLAPGLMRAGKIKIGADQRGASQRSEDTASGRWFVADGLMESCSNPRGFAHGMLA
jgi:hypothetical protein